LPFPGRSPSERFHLGSRVFYLHAPDGIGRSKLATGVEKALGVDIVVSFLCGETERRAEAAI